MEGAIREVIRRLAHRFRHQTMPGDLYQLIAQQALLAAASDGFEESLRRDDLDLGLGSVGELTSEGARLLAQLSFQSWEEAEVLGATRFHVVCLLAQIRLTFHFEATPRRLTIIRGEHESMLDESQIMPGEYESCLTNTK